MMCSDCTDKNSRHVGPQRRGAGSTPAFVKIPR